MELMGMITDRDLCCSVVAQGMDPKTTPIVKLITSAPLTCRDGENIEICERLMPLPSHHLTEAFAMKQWTAKATLCDQSRIKKKKI